MPRFLKLTNLVLVNVQATFAGAAIVILFIIAVGNCTRGVVSGGDYASGGHGGTSVSSSAPPVRGANPEMVRFHMHRHFDDLHIVEKFLIAGKLSDAKALAYMLTQPDLEPGMEQWNADSQRLGVEAARLMAANTIEQACRSDARVAGACMDCHRRSKNPPMFAAPPGVPTSQETIASRMARHQWAVDRLWEGVVGGVDGSWHMGLVVLATTALPLAKNVSGANRLQRAAQLALDVEHAEPKPDRAVTYGEILISCAGCHAQLHVDPAEERAGFSQ